MTLPHAPPDLGCMAPRPRPRRRRRCRRLVVVERNLSAALRRVPSGYLAGCVVIRGQSRAVNVEVGEGGQYGLVQLQRGRVEAPGHEACETGGVAQRQRRPKATVTAEHLLKRGAV